MTVDGSGTATDLEPGLGVLSEDLALHGHVVLGQPLAEEDGSGQRGLDVDIGEVLRGHHVHVLVRPLPLPVLNQPVQCQPITKITYRKNI